jgi:broad specificity phosphatase PhoE
MRLILIRHGQTPANVGGILDAAVPGPGLTELGERQAAAIPEALDGRPIDRVYVSSMVRTHLTVAPLAAARGLEPTQLDGLREIEAGDLQGASDKASVQQYVATVDAWALGDRDVPMPGGPDGDAFFARYDDAVARIAAESGPDDTVVAVSHGAAIRLWSCVTATNFPNDYGTKRSLSNTGIVELEGSPEDGWRLTDWEGTPLGGDELLDRTASDPTGERF